MNLTGCLPYQGKHSHHDTTQCIVVASLFPAIQQCDCYIIKFLSSAGGYWKNQL